MRTMTAVTIPESQIPSLLGGVSCITIAIPAIRGCKLKEFIGCPMKEE